MTPFLKWLNDEMENVDEFHEVDTEVGEENDTEVVIAEFDEDLRRLYTVMHNHFKELKEKKEALIKEGPFGISEEKIKELSWMTSRDELLTDLFWEEVRTLTGNPSKCLGIRKDFKIVAFEEKRDQNPLFSGSMIIGIGRL